MAKGIPTIANNAPRGPAWIPEKIAEIERELLEIRAARTLENASIGAGGITIDGGLIRLLAEDGSIVALLGSGSPFNPGHRGFAVLRSDGSVAFQADSNGFTGLIDKFGAAIVSNDIALGGLATPHIEHAPLINTNVLTWPATNQTSFTTIAACYMEIQNPRLTWQIQLFCDAAITSAQFKLLVNGSQIGTTQTVPTNSFALWSTVEDLPSGVGLGDVPLIELQAKAASGAGSARGQSYRLAGWQS